MPICPSGVNLSLKGFISQKVYENFLVWSILRKISMHCKNIFICLNRPKGHSYRSERSSLARSILCDRCVVSCEIVTFDI